MATLDAYGLTVDPPSRWEGRIFRRPEAGALRAEGVVGAAAPEGERMLPLVHVSTIPLPIDMADYGSDVVEDLGDADALIVLKEFDSAEAHQELFARKGMPRTLTPAEFDPNTLQRRLEGQAGYQEFFHEGRRAFCLYVVVGNFDRREQVIAEINLVLSTLQIAPEADAGDR
jgi:hypothetical protein